MRKIAIIDGDVMCYLSFEPRWEYSTNAHGIKEFVEDPVTGKMVPKRREYTKEEDAKYLKDSWERFQRRCKELVDKLYCTDMLVAVQGPGNFRPKLHPDYKGGRNDHRPSEMQKFVPIIRSLAMQTGFAVGSNGCEADDLIRWWSIEARNAGDDFIIASNDKDLLCIPGMHYNIKKDEFTEIDEAKAIRFYHEQLLMGDQVDKIPGLPGIGPKKAEEALAHCTTLEEFQEVVVGMYIAHYEDNWKDALLFNGKLIHIQRDENDWFDLSDWPLVQELTA